MTVTLTYRHYYLIDCEAVNQTWGGFTEDWSDAAHEHEDGNTANLTVKDDDIFHIYVTNSVGNKSVYYEWPDSAGANNLLASTTYPKILFRYKTSDTSIKAKIVGVFSDASTQTFLDEDSSTTWKTGTATISHPTGATLDHLRIYATQATGSVYYDFILIHKGTFTFPHIGPGEVRLKFPNKLVQLEAPSRDSDILQNLGLKSPEIILSGAVLEGEDWESAAGPHFEYILDALHKDPWNWFTCTKPYFRGKVMFRNFEAYAEMSDNKAALKWEMHLVVHSLSSLDLVTWGDVEWLGYES